MSYIFISRKKIKGKPLPISSILSSVSSTKSIRDFPNVCSFSVLGKGREDREGGGEGEETQGHGEEKGREKEKIERREKGRSTRPRAQW